VVGIMWSSGGVVRSGGEGGKMAGGKTVSGATVPVI
nr:hypothetical protein [Tanacetum cinerariifolium]